MLLSTALIFIAFALYLAYKNEAAIEEDLIFFGAFDTADTVIKILQFTNWKLPITLLVIGFALMCS
jgi:hypothetical protein